MRSDPWVDWAWVSRNGDVLVAATREHVELTLIALALGLAISVPCAVAASRWRLLETPLIGGAGVIYTIPSLALFALLVPWTGLSRTTAEIGLVGYTLLILMRNTLVGLRTVPADALDAATGMGMSSTARLVKVELPLAVPAMITGARVATVTTVGLVTVTALIGQGGLGQVILEGFNQDFRTKVVVGAALSIALAVVADLALAVAQRLLTPWARAR